MLLLPLHYPVPSVVAAPAAAWKGRSWHSMARCPYKHSELHKQLVVSRWLARTLTSLAMVGLSAKRLATSHLGAVTLAPAITAAAEALRQDRAAALLRASSLLHFLLLCSSKNSHCCRRQSVSLRSLLVTPHLDMTALTPAL